MVLSLSWENTTPILRKKKKYVHWIWKRKQVGTILKSKLAGGLLMSFEGIHRLPSASEATVPKENGYSCLQRL